MYNFPKNIIVIPTEEAEGFPGVHKFPFGNIAEYALPNSGRITAVDDLNFLSGHFVSLDGVGDYMSVPHTTDFDMASGTFAISFMVKAASIPLSATAIISKGGVTGGNGWAAFLNASGKIQFLFRGTGFTNKEADTVLSTGVWHTVSITIVDGVLATAVIDGTSSTITTLSDTPGTYVDSTENLAIGVRLSGGVPQDFFAGDLSAVSITDGNTTIASWLLNEHTTGTLTGLPAFDRSGNGNHGTYVGCEGNVGEGMPAEVVGLEEYGDYAYLETGDSVTLTSMAGDTSTSFSLSFDFLLPSISGSPYLISNVTSGIGIRLINSTTIRFAVGSLAGGAPAASAVQYAVSDLAGTLHTVQMDYDGVDTITSYLDGVLLGVGVVTPSVLSWTGLIIFNSTAGLARRVYFNGTLIAEGNGVTSAEWGGGTVSGSPLTIADKRRTIPQMFLQDWNKRMWFDGVNDYVVGGSINILGGADFEIFCTLYLTAHAAGDLVMSSPAGVSGVRLFMDGSGLVTIQSPGSGGRTMTGYTLPLNRMVTIKGVVAGGTTRLYEDGVLVSTQGAQTVFASNSPVVLGRYSSASTSYSKGLLLSGGVTSGGNTVTVTPQTGTVNGSPANIYLPEAITGDLDALGNPIDRPRNGQLNLTGVAGDSADIAYDPSLNVTTECTWAMTGNFWDDEAVTKVVLGRDDYVTPRKVFAFYRSAVHSGADGKLRLALSQSGAVNSGSFDISGFLNQNQTLVVRYNGSTFTLEAWIDGVPATVTLATGTVPASLFTTDIGVRIGQDFDGAGPSDQLIGSPVFYNRALTDSEIQKVHRYLQSRI